MYFVSTKSDTPGAQLAVYARFYYEKFPEAFHTEAESDSNASGDEEKGLVWTDDAHEEAFRNFDEKCRKFVKAEDPAGLLAFLLKFKPQIEALPISTK
jgi:ABC-type glycerol-3-phosphate transport system substrate-binding protein